MTTINVSHIPTTITTEKLQQFFGFCGTIKSINLIDKEEKFQKYEIIFDSPKAIETALLLNDAELDGVPIVVEEVPASSAPPSYADLPDTKEVSDHKVQEGDATYTGDEHYDDITQEEKPKSVILAQLLAQGYQLSDTLIEKSIKFDQDKGVTTKFKSFIENLDSKYLHTQQPNSTANKNINLISNKFNSLTSSFQKSAYQQKLNHYYDRAAKHPYGVKIHDFYKTLAKDANEVHLEAKRLNELKKEKSLESSQATANAAAAINTANE